MKFRGIYKKNGLYFGKDHQKLLDHSKKYVGRNFVLEDFFPESTNQRSFFEGAVIPLWVYLDGHDHKNSQRCKQYREYAKEEFNPEYVKIAGKLIKRGGSTKGKLNREGLIEKVIDFLEEQYGIDRIKVLDPKQYKDWKNRIYPNGGPDNYIDYLVEKKDLK